MADKRITELTNERLILGDGDYTIVDSNEGTYKYKLKRIMDAIPAIDDSLSHEGQSADAKAVGDALANVDVDTVNNARQLLSEKYLLDEEPYLFRASGGDGSDRVEECIVGGTVAWNQLAKFRADKSNTVVDVAVTVDSSTNTITLNGTSTGRGTLADLSLVAGAVIKDHIYFFHNEHTVIHVGGWEISSNKNYAYTVSKASDDSALTSMQVEVMESGVTFNNVSFKPMVIDLTAMFGSTIADYIYSLEQATAGAGVAWFKKYFPDDYYPYSAPTLRHVEGVSAKQIRDSDDNVTAIYPLDSSLTLRGVPKLTDGKMWFDGDVYEPDGTVTRKCSEYTFTGQENCAAYTSWGSDHTYAIVSLSDAETGVVGFISSIYPALTQNDVLSGRAVGMVIRGDNKNVYVSDPALTSTSAVLTKFAGSKVVYKLATPTTEQADPYTSTQVIDPHGTEEFVTTGIVPVGHYSKYLENLRSKIEGLPRDFSTLIAPTEKEYKATRNYTVGSLLIVDNILYKVTSAIANGGTITPNTNVTATTLAAVIAAL